MAWVSPRTWSVGEVPTSAMLNQDLRDNAQWLKDEAPALRATNNAGTAVTAGVGTNMILTDDGGAVTSNFDQGWGFTPPNYLIPTPLVGYYAVSWTVHQDDSNAAANHGIYAAQGTIPLNQRVASAAVNTAGTSAAHGPSTGARYIIRVGTANANDLGAYYYRGGGGALTTYFGFEGVWLRGL